MAHSYFHPGNPVPTVSGDPSLLQSHESGRIFGYPVLGPTQYPESVAFWHNHPVQHPGMSALSGPALSQKQPTQSAADQKKHKRTRSGCFTCRSRRVKCDEARPICDRCRKGKRDCVYPPPPTSKACTRANPKSREFRQSTQESDSSENNNNNNNEGGDANGLDVILDEEEKDDPQPRHSPNISTTKSGPVVSRRQSAQSLGKRRAKQASDSSSSSKEKSNSPRADVGVKLESRSPRGVLQSSGFENQPWQDVSQLLAATRLQEDLRFFLNYHQSQLNHHHYFLKPDADEFIHRNIIECALGYEPLLYAVVGFSAYHHSLKDPGGKLYTFLKYYNQALSLLRKSLGSGEQHSEATLITILELTTFEEYVGDWVNLVDHHQAAHTLVHELLTPETVNTNKLHRNIFVWYARFDIVAGLLAGNETILSRDWYISTEEHDAKEAAEHPNDVDKQLSLFNSRNRRFAMDMASLYAKLSRGMIPMDHFIVQNEQLSQLFESLRNLLTRFDNSEHAVQSYPHKKPLVASDIVDPYFPGRFFKGPLWPVNFAWIDLLATALMFKYQSCMALQQQDFSELVDLALEQCRFIETIERWPQKENGTVIAFHDSIGITSMFLPKDDRHIMWCRRKLALTEQNGYIYPPKLRTAMAELWQIPEVKHWWLPNDEGYLEIVREIRAMTEERTVNPRDNFREDVRDMKSLFSKLDLKDSGSQKSSPSASSVVQQEPSPGQSPGANLHMLNSSVLPNQ
ncbi:hypothetical protein VTN00DRAFT_194 [Thermoascus crustaceus]|uniref:uncharacterized protein n=1 Tax=Thermoascus crustaceus TaxID=5088 RepID=UPI0037441A15